MDVIAHTLWTNALFHAKYQTNRKLRYWAAFFGVAPDLVSFVPVMVYGVLSGALFSGQPWYTMTSGFFRYGAESYNYTHSLVIFAFTLILVTIIGNIIKYFQNPKKYRFWFFWPLLGWALHIGIDMFTHPDFYNTPVLFPLSSYRSNLGVSWAHPTFMLINYGLLILVYIAIFHYQSKKKKQR
jgi:membrane-bound metal-dependent hydrolase YbcI (DUF457 family)